MTIPTVLLYSAVRHIERGKSALDYPVFIRKYNALSALMGSCGFATFPTPPIPRHPCVFPESPTLHRLVNVSQYCGVERQRPGMASGHAPAELDPEGARREVLHVFLSTPLLHVMTRGGWLLSSNFLGGQKIFAKTTNLQWRRTTCQSKL